MTFRQQNCPSSIKCTREASLRIYYPISIRDYNNNVSADTNIIANMFVDTLRLATSWRLRDTKLLALEQIAKIATITSRDSYR